MPRLLLIIAALSALCGLLLIADRRLTRAILARRKAERDAAELRRKLTAPHRPGALSERLRAGPRYEWERINFAPRGLDPVTVHDGRVERVKRGAA